MSTLEAQYDTKLFDRVGRRISLTEAGQVFLEEARAVLAPGATEPSSMAWNHENL